MGNLHTWMQIKTVVNWSDDVPEEISEISS